MPIGKNAIKRVENNGYSHVQTTAPDMENSHVIANVDEQVMQTLVKPVEDGTKKTAPKKTSGKSGTKKSTVAKKPTTKQADEKVGLGTDLPYYLL